MRLTCLVALVASALAACGSASGKGQCATAGAVECVSTSIARVCATDNSWVTQQCGNDESCMGSGGCALNTDISCNTTDSGCVDSTHAVVCNSDGKGFQAVTCPTGTTCSGFGTCVGTCVVGSSRCSGSDIVQTCTDGFTFTDANCMPGMTSCVTTSAQNAALQSAACKPEACVPQGTVCGNKAMSVTDTSADYASSCVASPDGMHWLSEQCSIAGSCVPGSGCSQACIPGQQRCNGPGIQACDATGQWAAITQCQPTATGLRQVCQMPTGASDPVCGDEVCAAAGGACAADGYHACVNGKVSASGQACATGTCVGSTNYDGYIAGSCQAQCNAGDSRCDGNEAYQTCDTTLRWSSTVTQCPANGTDHCVGYTDPSNGSSKTICGQCAPGAHRCTDSGGNVPGTEVETCDVSGHYGSPAQCAMGQCQSVNNDAACVLQCVPGTTVCLGGTPASPQNPAHPGTTNWGTCDSTGNLPASGGTACTSGTSCRKHSNGSTVGASAAACVQCVGTDNESGFVDSNCINTASPNSIERCQSNNTWAASSVCSNTAPYGGVCVPEPGPVCGPGYTYSYCSYAYLTTHGYSGCTAWGYGGSDTNYESWGGVADCCNNPSCIEYSSGIDAPAACE